MKRSIGQRAAALFSTVAITAMPSALSATNDKEDIQSTIIRYKAAIGVNTKNPETHCKLGQAYLLNGQTDDAVSEFKKTLALDNKNVDAYIGWARANIRKRDYEGAINHLKEALKHDPENADIHFKLGQAYTQ